MTHLKLELSISQRETVSDKIIKKLYELVSSGTLDNTSHLQGWLYVPVTYRLYQETITDDNSDITKDLTVDYGDFAIPFEDPNMITYLNSIGVGSNGTVTEGLAQSATIVANSANTTVTKFNELRYFTNITESKGGLSGPSSGYVRFYGWTALEEVDISNFTSIGHNSGAAYEDTFRGCTALTTVTASNKLDTIGYSAFSGCTSLTQITGLPNYINLYLLAFSGCSSLPQSFFTGKTFNLADTGGLYFWNCTSVESITISSLTTTVGPSSFEGCSNLTTVNGLEQVTSFGNRAFFGCAKLVNTSLSPANITTLGEAVFYGCKLIPFGNLNLPNVTELKKEVFRSCKGLTKITLGNSCNISGNAVFYDCSGLTEANLGSNVTLYGLETFRSCSNLTTVTGLSNITTIPSNTFLDCSSLSSIDIDVSKLTSIGNSAFQNTGAALSGALTFSECLSIGQNAFYNCHNITELHFPKLTDVNQYHYWNRMNNLEVLDLPVATRLNICNSLPKLTTINAPSATVFGSYNTLKISECPLLTTLNINFSAVTAIGGYAFELDAGLAGQYFEFPNVTVVSQTSFNSCGINFIFSNNSVVLSAAEGVVFLAYTGTIYVPDALLSDYQSDSFWSRLGSNLLKGMSQLPANYNS